jgi:hypothetical protein
MQKLENNETVIILMTAQEAADLRQALKDTTEELNIVIKAGMGTEIVTSTDSEICKGIAEQIKRLLKTIDPDNPSTAKMADLAYELAHPQVYGKDSDVYKELLALDDTDYTTFLDELAKYGLTCNYNSLYNTYTIG